eukprot:m.35251 g.35251  ORF g.35251 m.35251 type:complete len:596 (-) comp8863_c0_seq1:474-2261(-)
MGQKNIQHESSVPLLDVSETGGKQSGTLSPTICCFPRNLYNVLMLSFSFLLLFTAFQTTQILAAKLIGDLGSISVGLIYVTFALGGFFAPAICRNIGPQTSMFIGGITYVFFVASLTYMITPVVLVASFFIGIGASILWTGQGMTISLNTTEQNKTTYNSLYWGIFNLCLVPGNLAAHFILKPGKSSNTTKHDPLHDMVTGWTFPDSVLFLALAVCGALGCAIFLLIRKPDPNFGTIPPVETRSAWTQIKATVALLGKPQMLCLLPIFTFNGVGMTMWSSWFPRQMTSTVIGLVMPCVGAAEFVGGLTMGRFVDAFGRSPGLALGASFYLGALALTYLGNQKLTNWCSEHHPKSPMPCEEFDSYYPFYLAAILYGLGDCTFQSCTGAICAKSFNASGHGADSWALNRTFQSIGSAVCFFLSNALSIDGGKTSSASQLTTEIAIVVVMLYLALMGHWMFCKYTLKNVVKTDKAADPVGGMYSQAVIVSGFVYTAGCIGLPPGHTPAEFNADNSVAEQTRLALENLKAVLKESGCTVKDVVKTTVFLSNIDDAKEMNSEYQKVFVDDNLIPPARSMVAVKTLPLGAKVELEAVAALP